MSLEIGSKVYVVTNIDAGWDCIDGVYATYESLLQYFLDWDDYEKDEFPTINKDTTLDELEIHIDNYINYLVIHIEYLR